jgi:DNA polymerase-2
LLEDAAIKTYEADVRFTYRFMIDHDIRGSCDIIGQPQQHAFVDCFYEEPHFAAAEFALQPRTLCIDIETGQRGQALYCVSLVGSDGLSKVLVVSAEPVAGRNVEHYPTQKACLEAFTAAVRAHDPDIITGWSVIDFDLQTLRDLCEREHVPFIFGRSDDVCKLKLDAHYFRESMADVPGRMVLDGIALFKASFIRMEDYKLDTAAAEVLGEQKLITLTGLEKVKEIERQYREDKATLVEYCRRDSELVFRILQKKQLIELAVQRSILAGMQLDRVRASIASLDNVYLHELAARNIAAPTNSYKEKEEQITGGYVMQSTPGIYDYVIVCDFKSLYPSIMRTLNIDPLSFVPAKPVSASSEQFVVAENGAVFENTTGILPAILDKLHSARERARTEKNQVAVGAIKVLMNSFFGVLASPQCRFFSLDVANAITLTGQHIIKLSAQLIAQQGYTVIYGDTDSIFIDLNVDNAQDAQRIGKLIEQSVNEYLREYAKTRYHRESRFELQFDKTFVRFFMPMTRGGEASKKRYAGMRIDKEGKEHIDFTGLEFVRRDWTDLAHEFQLGMLDRIFHKQEVTEYVKQFVFDLKAGKLDSLLVYKKALRKDLSEYTKTTPQHVKAARQMETIGSSIIEYVVTERGPQPLEQRTAKIDYQHYIDKQLKPIANSALQFYNANFDDLLAGSTQKNLFSF